jgi:hypothetical protein
LPIFRFIKFGVQARAVGGVKGEITRPHATLQNETTQYGSAICVARLCHVGKIVTSNRLGLNTGCDTVGRRSEEESLFSVSIDTIETRSVSDWLAHCDTDRWVSHQMTLRGGSHDDFLSTNPKQCARHQNRSSMPGRISQESFQERLPSKFKIYVCIKCTTKHKK